MAHMAFSDSIIFLKDPSTLESVIRGACFMQSCLWHWLAGFSINNSKDVPSFQSPLVLHENNCSSEGQSKGKNRNSELDIHPLYSHMYIYIASAKRSLITCHTSTVVQQKDRGGWRCPGEIQSTWLGLLIDTYSLGTFWSGVFDLIP